jgi:hypothetical protein
MGKAFDLTHIRLAAERPLKAVSSCLAHQLNVSRIGQMASSERRLWKTLPPIELSVRWLLSGLHSVCWKRPAVEFSLIGYILSVLRRCILFYLKVYGPIEKFCNLKILCLQKKKKNADKITRANNHTIITRWKNPWLVLTVNKKLTL